MATTEKQPKEEEVSSPLVTTNSTKQAAQWLNAFHDPVASVKAYSACIGLADLNTDGDHKLLIADQDRKLKVYRGI